MKKRKKKSRFKRGSYFFLKANKEFKYRSSWELAYMKFLDSDLFIVSYDYESIKIPYLYRKKKSNYIPDFIIDNKIIVEIKPKRHLLKKRNISKFYAAQEYCLKNSMTFKVITENDLKLLGII